jgi:hypothetical protein
MMMDENAASSLACLVALVFVCLYLFVIDELNSWNLGVTLVGTLILWFVVKFAAGQRDTIIDTTVTETLACHMDNPSASETDITRCVRKALRESHQIPVAVASDRRSSRLQNKGQL